MKRDLATIHFSLTGIYAHEQSQKFFDAHAMGNACNCYFQVWIWDLGQWDGIGFITMHCSNHDFALIARNRKLEKSPEKWDEMSRRARQLAETSFEKQTMVSRILDILEGCKSSLASGSPGFVS